MQSALLFDFGFELGRTFAWWGSQMFVMRRMRKHNAVHGKETAPEWLTVVSSAISK